MNTQALALIWPQWRSEKGSGAAGAFNGILISQTYWTGWAAALRSIVMAISLSQASSEFRWA